MIQIIGLMIGIYTFARLLEIAARPGVNYFVSGIAGLAMLGEGLCVAMLLLSGTHTTPPLPY